MDIACVGCATLLGGVFIISWDDVCMLSGNHVWGEGWLFFLNHGERRRFKVVFKNNVIQLESRSTSCSVDIHSHWIRSFLRVHIRIKDNNKTRELHGSIPELPILLPGVAPKRSTPTPHTGLRYIQGDTEGTRILPITWSTPFCV